VQTKRSAPRKRLAVADTCGVSSDPFLELAENLARFHREHEKFYARAPLEEAVAPQRTSAALRALAERWSTVEPHTPQAASPFSGAEDLNDERAIELAGILFMEGQGEPTEITRIKRELGSAAQGNDEAGQWLGAAMATSWQVAENLLRFPALADLLAERHRIISNDWQAASLAKLVARHLERARAVIERAERILDEHQQLERGDRVALAPDGSGLDVERIEPGRLLVLREPTGGWTWAFLLRPSDGRTRLLARNRWTTKGASLAFRLCMTLIDPAAFVMERRMLLGIKQRAGRGASRAARGRPGGVSATAS
jgi:hypothetical protein